MHCICFAVPDSGDLETLSRYFRFIFKATIFYDTYNNFTYGMSLDVSNIKIFTSITLWCAEPPGLVTMIVITVNIIVNIAKRNVRRVKSGLVLSDSTYHWFSGWES